MNATVRFGLISYVLIIAGAASAQDIRGVVVDSAGKPVEGVVIELYPSSRGDSAANTKTNVKGEYEFKAPKFTAPFDIIYSHSRMDDTSVYLLSHNKTQEINKVMYLRGERRDPVALLDSLQTVERILFMSLATEDPSRQAALKTHLNPKELGSLLKEDSLLITTTTLNREALDIITTKQKDLRIRLPTG